MHCLNVYDLNRLEIMDDRTFKLVILKVNKLIIQDK